MLRGLFSTYPPTVRGAVAAALVLTLAYLVAEAVTRVLAGTIGRVSAHVPGDIAARSATRGALRAVRLIITLLVAGTLIFPAMSLVGLRSRVGLSPEGLGNWAMGSGLRIALIALLAWMVLHVVSVVVTRLEGELSTTGSVDVIERAKRARTVGTLIQNTVYVLISTVSTLMVLRELNVDITPILTGAGIVGLAVGFGAQSLVKDIISGFFLILENQIRVGDVANIDGTGGLVERITLRTIILRDEAGAVHVIPNGSIQRLSNLTKDYSFYVTSIAVSSREDTDRVTDVLVQIAEELLLDERFAPGMLGPLEVIGVDRFSEGSVDIKVRLKTVPIKQWTIGREFLRRVNKAFDQHRFETPSPYRTVLVTQPDPVAPTPDADRPSAPRQT